MTIAVLLGALTIGVLSTPTPAAGQDRGEQDEALLDQAVELFRRAEAVFNSQEQDRSVRLLTDLINLLERRLAVGNDEEFRSLLVRSVSYRAQVHYNFGQLEQADADMRQLISLNPGHELDTTTLSPKFVERFEELRSEMVGRLDIILTPSNAELLVDGRQARPSLGPVNVLAGHRVVSASLPGYTPFQQGIEVAANEIHEMVVELERVYAVARIVTWPKGATVTVDGEVVGTTEGSPPLEFFPVGDAAMIPIHEFSDYMNLELLPGTHRLEISRSGYRSEVLELQAPELTDYEPEPVVLEPARGDIVLTGVPEGAVVTVDGAEAAPEDGERLTVDPGDHVVAVEHPTEGYFEIDLRVADGDELPVDVEMRPVANLVGIVGADELAAGALTDTLRASFTAQESWILRDRTGDAEAVLDRMSTVQTVLQQAAQGDSENLRGVPWRRIQAELDEAVPGSLYVLAVLSDDLMATHADVWVLAPAPGPTEPDRIRVAIEDMASIERFASRLNLPEFSYRAWWGGAALDSPDGGTVIAQTQEGGPAATAGLQPGDQLLSVDGAPVRTAADLGRLVDEAAPGSTISVLANRSGTEQVFELVLGESPSVSVARSSEIPAAAVWVAANRALQTGDAGVPEWMLRLNAAIAHMRVRDWTGAVRMLRTIDAPAEPGLGKAAVDYLLGVSLYSAGGEYEASARESLARAAESMDGRLYHNDGPLVRPRALARLGTLDALGTAVSEPTEAVRD